MRYFFLLVALATLPCSPLRAAQQAGYVRAAGQPIPGATVTATQGATKVVAFTDENGRYTLNLAPGMWDVQVEMLGFIRTLQRMTIPGQSGTSPAVVKDFILEMPGQGANAVAAQETSAESASQRRGFQRARVTATQDGQDALIAAAAGVGDVANAGGGQDLAFLVNGSTSARLGAASDDYARLQRQGREPQAAPEPRPEFEAASVKSLAAGGGSQSGGTGCGALTFTPGRVAGTATAQAIILEAYQLTPYQLSGGPSWLNSDRFCLDAKVSTPADKDQLRPMLQTLLAERFKLVVRRTTKEMPVYALTVAKNGPTLHELKPGDPFPGSVKELAALFKFRDIQGAPAGAWSDRKNMKDFADALSRNPLIDRPVLDKTGLQGEYLIFLRWGADDNFMSAVEEQFGLKFEAERAPMDNLVIEQIEEPSEN
jgi:uncharacterized protein (TIGR03435 family)